MGADERDLIVAANRYVEGGRKPEDLLIIAQSLADVSNPEEFERKLRLLGTKRQQKRKQSG